MKKKWKLILGFLDSNTHWQRLKPFFSVAIFRFFLSWFAIAPVFVKIAQHLPDPFVFVVNGEAVSIPLTLPFNWWILWFAALSYLIANALFAGFCPIFIKRYGSFSDFAVEGHSPRYIAHKIEDALTVKSKRSKLIDRLLTKGYLEQTDYEPTGLETAIIEKDGTSVYLQIDQKYWKLSFSDETKADRQRDVFWEAFEVFCDKNFVARLLIIIFLIISYLSVIWVLFQQICFVLNFLVETA